MKSAKLIDIFKQGHIVIPLFMLQHYKELKLEIGEFLFLMYLYNLGNKFIFDPSKFASDLNLDIKDMRFESSPLIEDNIADTIETPNVVDIVVEEPKKKKKKKVKDEEEGEEELPDIEVSEQTPTELPKQYNIKIFSNDEEYNVTCFENQTILSALELSNVRVRSKCRCGECGYCRSLLLWGTIRVKEVMEHRRKADIKFNYIKL